MSAQDVAYLSSLKCAQAFISMDPNLLRFPEVVLERIQIKIEDDPSAESTEEPTEDPAPFLAANGEELTPKKEQELSDDWSSNNQKQKDGASYYRRAGGTVYRKRGGRLKRDHGAEPGREGYRLGQSGSLGDSERSGGHRRGGKRRRGGWHHFLYRDRQQFQRKQKSPEGTYVEEERQRGQRFSEEENERLVAAVLDHYRDLCGQSAMKGSATRKRRLWQEVTNRVNEVASTYRTIEVCKKRYGDCRRAVKLKMAAIEHQALGRGEPAEQIRFNHWEEKLRHKFSSINCGAVPGRSQRVLDTCEPATLHINVADPVASSSMEAPERGVVSFEEVAVYFTEEEWRGLRVWQRELYKEVMMDNIRMLSSVDPGAVRPEVILKILMGNVLYGDYVPRPDAAAKPRKQHSLVRRETEKPPLIRPIKPKPVQEVSSNFSGQHRIVVHLKEPEDVYGQDITMDNIPHLCRMSATCQDLIVIQDIDECHEPMEFQEAVMSRVTLGIPEPSVSQVTVGSLKPSVSQVTVGSPEPEKSQEIVGAPEPAMLLETVDDPKPAMLLETMDGPEPAMLLGTVGDPEPAISQETVGDPKPAMALASSEPTVSQETVYQENKGIPEPCARQETVGCQEQVPCKEPAASNEEEVSPEPAEDPASSEHPEPGVEVTLPLDEDDDCGKKLYICSSCGETFDVWKYLVRHFIVHGGMKPYQCPDCGKCFTYPSKLTTHRKTHERLKSHLCMECGRCFIHESNLVLHQKTHSGDKPHVCPECGKSFLYRSKLVAHQKTHAENKTHPCPDCEKTFDHKCKLLVHQELHSGQKPFQCSVCKKGFPRKSSLIIHMRRHTGERPYVCHLCSRSFVEHAKLRRHIRVHTGEKPFQCSECGKLFNDSSTMNRHKRMHHGKPNPSAPDGQQADAVHRPDANCPIKTEKEDIDFSRHQEVQRLPGGPLRIKSEKVETPVSERRLASQTTHRTTYRPQVMQPKEVFRWPVNNQKLKHEKQLALEGTDGSRHVHAEPVLRWTVSNQEVQTQEECALRHPESVLPLHSEPVLKWSVSNQQVKEEPMLDYPEYGELLEERRKRTVNRRAVNEQESGQHPEDRALPAEKWAVNRLALNEQEGGQHPQDRARPAEKWAVDCLALNEQKAGQLLEERARPAEKWTVNRLLLNEQDMEQIHKGVQREYRLRCVDCGQAFLTLSRYIKHRRQHRLEKKQGLLHEGLLPRLLAADNPSDAFVACRDLVLKNLDLTKSSDVNTEEEPKMAAFHAFPQVPSIAESHIPVASEIQAVQLE